MPENPIAAKEKNREPRQTKKLPVLFFGSNLEGVTTTYEKLIKGRRKARISS
jgi:hypothetical protein